MDEFKFYEMETFKKSRKKVTVGDVFVIKLKDYDVYFYGKLICDDVIYCGSNFCLMFLYKTPTQGIIIPDDMNINDIMQPFIGDRSNWNFGYFKSICNIPVKDSEINADYGFCSIGHNKMISRDEVEKYSKNHRIERFSGDQILASPYVDCYANVLDHEPAILSNSYSLALAGAFYGEISIYLHKHPEIRQKFGVV